MSGWRRTFVSRWLRGWKQPRAGSGNVWSVVAGTPAVATNANTVASQAVALGAAVNVGDVVVIVAGHGTNSPATDTCADQLGNVYVRAAADFDPPGVSQGCATFYSIITHAGTPTITVTGGAGAADFWTLCAAAYRGSAGVPTFDKAATTAGGAAAGAGNVQALAVTPAKTGALAVAGFLDTNGAGSFAAAGGFTGDANEATPAAGILEHSTATTAGQPITAKAQCSAADRYCAQVLVFSAAGS